MSNWLKLSPCKHPSWHNWFGYKLCNVCGHTFGRVEDEPC